MTNIFAIKDNTIQLLFTKCNGCGTTIKARLQGDFGKFDVIADKTKYKCDKCAGRKTLKQQREALKNANLQK